MFPSLTNRATLAERMDDADCCEKQLLRTIDQFTLINRLISRYRGILRRWVLADMLHNPKREYHLLDMGAGGCDIDVWLLDAAHRYGLRLRITACDLDPRIVQYARSLHQHIPGLSILQRDVLTETVDEPVDYVFANHFLHHLSNKQINLLLRQWAPQVARKMIFSDLRRTHIAYIGFWFFSTFYRHSFIREDGLISIRRSFRAEELRAIMESTGIGAQASVYELQPARLALVVERTHELKNS